MLHLSFVAARNRESGKTELLEFVSHVAAGGDRAAVGALNDEFRAADGGTLRARYSDVTVMIDNTVVATDEFPDPAKVERERKQRQLTEAKTALESAAQREVAALQAATDAKAAKDERKAASARVAELERDLGIGPRRETLAEAEPDEYAELTVPQLKERCEELGIDVAGFRLRREFIDALVNDDKLSALTIAQLKERAEALEIPIAGLKRKRQFLDAIEKRERDAADLAQLDDGNLRKVAAELGIEFAHGASRAQISQAILKATA